MDMPRAVVWAALLVAALLQAQGARATDVRVAFDLPVGYDELARGSMMARVEGSLRLQIEVALNATLASLHAREGTTSRTTRVVAVLAQDLARQLGALVAADNLILVFRDHVLLPIAGTFNFLAHNGGTAGGAGGADDADDVLSSDNEAGDGGREGARSSQSTLPRWPRSLPILGGVGVLFVVMVIGTILLLVRRSHVHGRRAVKFDDMEMEELEPSRPTSRGAHEQRINTYDFHNPRWEGRHRHSTERLLSQSSIGSSVLLSPTDSELPSNNGLMANEQGLRRSLSSVLGPCEQETAYAVQDDTSSLPSNLDYQHDAGRTALAPPTYTDYFSVNASSTLASSVVDSAAFDRAGPEYDACFQAIPSPKATRRNPPAAKDPTIAVRDLQGMSQVGRGQWGPRLSASLHGKKVHIKTFKQTFKPRRFFREAKELGLLDHPNILQLKGITVQPIPMIITEFAGPSLSRALSAAAQRPTLSKLQSILLQLTNAVEYLHEHDVVHHCLSSDSVLVASDFSVCKLSGFGEANLSQAARSCRAPEVLRFGMETRASNMWSLGLICAEVISTGAPFGSMDSASIEEALLDGLRPTRSPRCPPFLYDGLLRCWHPHPKFRPNCAYLTGLLESDLRVPLAAIAAGAAHAEVGGCMQKVFRSQDCPSRAELVQWVNNPAEPVSVAGTMLATRSAGDETLYEPLAQFQASRAEEPLYAILEAGDTLVAEPRLVDSQTMLRNFIAGDSIDQAERRQGGPAVGASAESGFFDSPKQGGGPPSYQAAPGLLGASDKMRRGHFRSHGVVLSNTIAQKQDNMLSELELQMC